MSTPDLLTLADAISTLAEMYGDAPSYTRLWRAINRRQIPAHRIAKYYLIDRGDLPKLAEHFGLRPSVPTAA